MTFSMATTLIAAGISGQKLYETLLKANLTNLPTNYSTPTISPVTFNEQNKGPLGGVQVEFPTNDVKTGIVYLVFEDRNETSEYNRKHLPPQIPGEKLLAYPPMARCALTPNGAGYCDMWIQDYNVIMVAAASNMDAASELMSVGLMRRT